MTKFSKQLSSIEIQDLLVLLLVAQLGSFHQAATSLGLKQSTISRRIRKLEDALGVSLFNRRSTGVQLTNAGHLVFDQFNDIRLSFGAAVYAAQHAGVSDTGTLRIAVAISIVGGVARQILKAFLKNHPAVHLKFVETDCPTALKMLSHREIDVAIVCGDQPDGNYDTLVVDRERVLVAVSSLGFLANRSRLSWHDVRGENFIVNAEGPGREMHDYVIKRASVLGELIDVERVSVGREGLMSLVGLGFGLSIVAYHWTNVTYPNVAFIPFEDDRNPIDISICWCNDNDNPALRRLISLARIEATRNGALS
ncbi:LysR family transcriptional regulator [uncultured Tateyamaria sp.]|uniref:LysR family transcriptional regulator n=1 Tax=uncultured Tateyamaria sp. TaxID=455651 RepID=UPI002622FDF8|nr:LysR family transcriptional regulator [uncultured Tateyamaria sp.]